MSDERLLFTEETAKLRWYISYFKIVMIQNKSCNLIVIQS